MSGQGSEVERGTGFLLYLSSVMAQNGAGISGPFKVRCGVRVVLGYLGT